MWLENGGGFRNVWAQKIEEGKQKEMSSPSEWMIERICEWVRLIKLANQKECTCLCATVVWAAFRE